MTAMQRYQLPILVLILLLTFAARLINIGVESLWVDEGFSYWTIQHDDLFGVLRRDVHPPLYFLALRGWSGLTGLTELALRYFSVLPSVLSVAMIYQVGRELVRQRGLKEYSSIPLLAALMLALADMETSIAQEVRMYTWHVLWVLVSMWAFLRWIRLSTHKTGGRYLVIWIISTLLLLYTHYIGAASVAVQGLYALLFLRGKPRLRAIGGLVFAGALFIPWLLFIVSDQTDNIGTGYNVPSTLESLWNYRINWFTQQWALMGGLAMLGIIGLARGSDAQQHVPTVGTSNGMSETPRFHTPFLLLAWLVVPVILTYLLNFRVPILIDYRITQITPAVALLVAFGLDSIPQPTRAFLIAVIVVYGVVIDDTPVARPPWREVGLNAARYAQSGDLALAHITPSGDWQVMYYYERFMPEGVETRSLRQWQIEQGDTYADGLPELLNQYEQVWFMHWSKDRSGFEALEQTGYTQTAVMSEDWLGNDLNVYRFDRLPESMLDSFQNGMMLRDADIPPDQLRVDLFWMTSSALDSDYTVSVILLDENGVLVAQDDAQPFVNQRPTSSWQPGEVVYDPHTLQLLDGLSDLAAGTYTVGVKVYLWTPDGIQVQPTDSSEEFTVIGALER